MTDRPSLPMSNVVLGAPDAHDLAAFYQRLLGWTVQHEQPGWVKLRPPDGAPALCVQTEPGYARACGAEEAEHQPQEDVRVYPDPAGHPFCLFAPT